MLSLSQPEIIKQKSFGLFAGGADIIETNTFNSTSAFLMADYQMEDLVPEINRESARLAREAADEITALNPEKPRLVAGSMGPTNKTASLSPDVNNPGFRAIDFDTLVANYREQALALIEGGADILLVETVFDTLNAKAALFALEELFDELGREYPIMVSGTTDASGPNFVWPNSGGFFSLSHVPLMSIGLNCALGADQLRPYVQTLANKAPFAVTAHPNAGLPNAFGEYDQGPEEMKELIKEYLGP